MILIKDIHLGNKRITRVLVCMLILGLVSGCGRQSASENSTTTIKATTEAPKLTDEHSEGAVEYVPKARDVTKYIMYNGEKVEIHGNPIAEDVFVGDYSKIKTGIDKHLTDLKKVELDSVVRNDLKYTWNYDDKSGMLSSLPVMIEFGRGIDFGDADGWLSFNDEQNEKKHKELIDNYGTEEGERIYLNYLTQSRVYTADLYYVAKEKKEITMITCAYTIDGDKVHFQEIEKASDFSLWEKSFTEDFTYNFDGLNLELSNDEGDICLYPNYSMNSEVHYHLSEKVGWDIHGEALDRESTFKNIAVMSLFENQDSIKKNLVFFTDATTAEGLDANVRYDGHISLSWTGIRTLGEHDKSSDPDSFECDIIGFSAVGTGVTFISDNKAYVYTNFSGNYNGIMTKDIVTESDIDDDKLEEVMQNQTEAAETIKNAVDTDALGVLIDAVSGEASVNGEVLFATDKSELNDKGKEVLDEFLVQYVPVIEQLKKDGTIEGIQITGHTDSNGGYEYNMKLSQDRADNVLNYILENYPDMKDSFTSRGIAYNDRIFNEDGTENKEASRRVTFRLIIK